MLKTLVPRIVVAGVSHTSQSFTLGLGSVCLTEPAGNTCQLKRGHGVEDETFLYYRPTWTSFPTLIYWRTPRGVPAQYGTYALILKWRGDLRVKCPLS